MPEYGEWNRKGATLSDVNAQKEYGITRAFIEEAIRAGELEYRQCSVWGNPYIRILRSQLELYIQTHIGKDYLDKIKRKEELLKIKKEIVVLTQKLQLLYDKQKELEASE